VSSLRGKNLIFKQRLIIFDGHSFKATFTRRTNGHGLGTFRTVNVSVFPIIIIIIIIIIQLLLPVSKIIHQKLAQTAELIEDKSPYYKYTPASVLENENFKLYWNHSILTDKTIPFNRPDNNFYE